MPANPSVELILRSEQRMIGGPVMLAGHHEWWHGENHVTFVVYEVEPDTPRSYFRLVVHSNGSQVISSIV